MFKYTNKDISEFSSMHNFNKNMTEKVLRLCSVLEFINESEFTNELVLKGGTAINLFLLNLPRLSVDIDLDFNNNIDRESMLERRSLISDFIKRIMKNEGYLLHNKSKFTHTLDSFVFSYKTTSNSNDILKIDINYSNRVHILQCEKSMTLINTPKHFEFTHLSNDELIGSKINALIVRTTPRDLYDVYNLFKNNYITNYNLIKKIAIFYICLGSDIPIDFNILYNDAIERIKQFNYNKIRETLIPVLHIGLKIDLDSICNYVIDNINALFTIDEDDITFINNINNKEYKPLEFFTNYSINNEIIKHPMGIWKTK